MFDHTSERWKNVRVDETIAYFSLVILKTDRLDGGSNEEAADTSNSLLVSIGDNELVNFRDVGSSLVCNLDLAWGGTIVLE